jgi:site-specific DNA recombinase
VRSRAQHANLLTGLLVDEHGTKLTSTHAVKDGKRYRYYVGSADEGGKGPVWRLPAHEIETLVTTELVGFLSNQQRLCDALQPWAPSPDQLEGAFHAAEVLASRLKGSAGDRREALLAAGSEIRLYESELIIGLPVHVLMGEARPTEMRRAEVVSIPVPAAFVRRAAEMKIVVPGREVSGTADPALLKAIARGHTWFEDLATGAAATIMEIAARENVTDRYVASLIRLAFMPPRLVSACLAGEPTSTSLAAAITSGRRPLLWSESAPTHGARPQFDGQE